MAQISDDAGHALRQLLFQALEGVQQDPLSFRHTNLLTCSPRSRMGKDRSATLDGIARLASTLASSEAGHRGVVQKLKDFCTAIERRRSRGRNRSRPRSWR